MINIDTTGMICPQPLIETRRALKRAQEGEEIVVIGDNETAMNNILTYLKDQHIQADVTTSGNEFTLRINATEGFNPEVKAEAYCCPTPSANDGSYVVVIKSILMGDGDPDLGAILMKGFLNALLEVEPLPTHIVFYNSGVNLVVNGSGVDSTLKELEQKGIKIIVCGTCVDYYNIKREIAVGTISNMLQITEILKDAGHIVQP
ncbi:sulfurtransferase-like selenium metabolism protein YedF [Puteibacter caeruleilacunae]|nr:sulfurtransferase-like selenium metabolism protein YedF [Puteibacter caeruleilacunae]